ncbi:Global cell cycle regulator GcrA [Cohaesibacter marisflavi]|uniref:Global cell cycle regulator GcrA n=1 Tax=Cohaesibacter marisflavi TaxID=655353 RepID=A0A1I5CWV3_9HYPH|nr:GcrA family cell cycle regulator [Cohaesibacter marisflavi]SFN91397.1 Global cell cycle regulator GcrA [Cohaesibacter marisflavi]
MSWTDERVELLKKLWAEGLSASQVASELGGVTRNAVIGKVHRLGLSGRAKTTTTAPRPRRPRNQQTSRPARTSSSSTAAPSVGATALKVESQPQSAPQPKAVKNPQADPVVVPISKRASILTLTETTCKWPIGDPGDTDFHFCGHKSESGSPYCKYHSEIAYNTGADRRRSKKAS